jgi:hypothetical protein
VAVSWNVADAATARRPMFSSSEFSVPDTTVLMLGRRHAKIGTAKFAIMRWRVLSGFPVAGECDGSVA